MRRWLLFFALIVPLVATAQLAIRLPQHYESVSVSDVPTTVTFTNLVQAPTADGQPGFIGLARCVVVYFVSGDPVFVSVDGGVTTSTIDSTVSSVSFGDGTWRYDQIILSTAAAGAAIVRVYAFPETCS